MGENSKISWTHQTKVAARYAVNLEVRTGRLQKPNDLPCADCGHVYDGGMRHEYDHHLGYDREHWLSVQAVCVACHVRRDSPKANQTHCVHGHEYTDANTGRHANGRRFCRQCRRQRESAKRTAEWWRIRRERKAA